MLKKSCVATVIASLLSTSALAGRVDATADVALYVAPSASCATGYWGVGGTVTNCGSDNDAVADGSQANPYATCQHAVDKLYSDWDFKGKYRAIVNMASKPSGGSFFYPRCSISGRLVGQPGTLPPLFALPGMPSYAIGNYKAFTIQGDPANPPGAYLTSGDFGVDASGPALSVTEGALFIDGLGFDSGMSHQDNIDVMVNTWLVIGKIWVVNAGAPTFVDQNGLLQSTYNLNIGCAFNSGMFLEAGGGIDAWGNALAFVQTGDGCPILANNNGGQTGNYPIVFHGGRYSQAPIILNGSGTFYKAGIAFSGTFSSAGYVNGVFGPSGPSNGSNVGWGILNTHNAVIENGTGLGPNTCPSNLLLGHPTSMQDNSSCR